MNENTLSRVWDFDRTRPDGPHQKLLLAEFRKWLAAGNRDSKANRRPYNNPLFRQFLSETHKRTLAKMTRYLREELNCKTLITDFNCGSEFQNAPARQGLDLVDIHEYYNHPSSWGKGKLGLPVRFVTKETSLRRPWIATCADRIFGKPMTITEIQYVAPNPCRMESGPIIGAYSALQDIDGIYRFDWAEAWWEMGKPAIIASFSMIQDQSNRLADIIALHLFRRGDTAPANNSFAIPIRDDMPLWKQQIGPFWKLAMISKVGYSMDGKSVPGVKPVNPAVKNFTFLSNQTRFVSDTGEIITDSAARTMTVVTPKTECAVVSGKEIRCKRLTVRNADGFQVVAAISRDNLPLSESRRILFLQISDTKNNLQKFEDRSMRQLLDYGKLPILAKAVRADIQLELPEGKWNVSAVDFDGSIKKTIPSSFRDGRLNFKADTRTAMIYELTR